MPQEEGRRVTFTVTLTLAISQCLGDRSFGRLGGDPSLAGEGRRVSSFFFGRSVSVRCSFGSFLSKDLLQTKM